MIQANRLTDRQGLQGVLDEPRAIVYLTVEWAAQERSSRRTFAEFLERIRDPESTSEISFWILGDELEGAVDWLDLLGVPGVCRTGYGAVLWLGEGQILDSVSYAALAGAEGLVERTLDLWNSR